MPPANTWLFGRGIFVPPRTTAMRAPVVLAPKALMLVKTVPVAPVGPVSPVAPVAPVVPVVPV
ncbi:hypothetical protein C7R92_16435, partial [Brevibacillus porteri]